MAITSSVLERQNEQGFALLEALLALFILTIGILGVAGLQIQSMQSGSVAMQRLTVTMKTRELIERMMANPGLTTVTRTDSAATNSVISTSVTAEDVANYVAAGAGQYNSCDVATVECTPLQMAQQDIFTWRADLMTILPAATGANAPTFTVQASPNRDVTVTVTWNDRGNAYSYAVTTQIQPLVVEKSGI